MKKVPSATFRQRLTTLFNRHRLRCDAAGERFTRELYAKRIGATLGMLRGWLSGAGEPSTDALARIARVEGVSVDWLVGATDDERPPRRASNDRLSEEIAGEDAETRAQLEQFYSYLKFKKAQEATGSSK